MGFLGEEPTNVLVEDIGLPEEAILSTAPISVNISMDSGAVAHVANPDMLPPAAVKPPTRVRAFRTANGGSIKHHGTASVTVVGDKMPWRHALMEFESADVNRALQSTGATCDRGKEVLFTKDACYVVAAGLLSPILKREDLVQAFRREPGGLYSRAVQIGVPPAQAESSTAPASGSAASNSNASPVESASTFQRQGSR